MIELPEACALAAQVGEVLTERRVARAEVLHSPHKFTWFAGEPESYPAQLANREITGAESHGGMLIVQLDSGKLVLHEGPVLRFHRDSTTIPKKHQLLLEFVDGSALSVSVAMYGGIAYFTDEWDNPYYRRCLEAISPLADSFTLEYFDRLRPAEGWKKLSAKAFLATEQRVPGLGNGVLQDILFAARIHPKRKLGSLGRRGWVSLYDSVRNTLAEMTRSGGRDTETDLFGRPGGYKTILSRKTVGTQCPHCSATIEKASYMGGSVYFCPRCQPLG